MSGQRTPHPRPVGFATETDRTRRYPFELVLPFHFPLFADLWLAATFYPCPAGTAPGTPETVFALKRSLEAWTEPTHLTRGSVTSQVQQRSARTSPRCDVAVVPPVYLDVWCTFPDARSGCCGWAFSSGDRDRGRSPAVGDRAGLPVHLGLPTHEPGSGGDLAPFEVTPQGDE